MAYAPSAARPQATQPTPKRAIEPPPSAPSEAPPGPSPAAAAPSVDVARLDSVRPDTLAPDSLAPESLGSDSLPPGSALPARAEDRPTAPPPALALELASALITPEPVARSITRSVEKGATPEDPSIVADSLAESLAWLSDERRPVLFRHVLSGDYESALTMLREDRERLPRVLSIAKAVEITERAIAANLLHEIGPLSSELVVRAVPSREEDESPRATLLRFSRTSATLGDLLDASPLPRLRTVKIIHDLCEDESLILRVPSRTSGGLRIGSSAALAAVSDRKVPVEASEQRPVPKATPSARGARSDEALPVIGTENGPPARSDGIDEAVFVFPHDPRRDPEEESGSSAHPPRKPRASSVDSRGKRELLVDSDDIPRELLDRRTVRPAAEKPVRATPSDPERPPPSGRQDLPRDPRTWLPTVLGGAAALISAATLVTVTFRAPPAAVTVIQTAPPAPTVTAVAAVPAPEVTVAPPAPEPTSVQLSIDVSPPYAQVFLDGVPLQAPVRRSIVRSDVPHELRVIAGGFKSETRRFSPTAHTSFVIALEPVQKLSDP